jgi:diacylglycerol kinase family enzyme
VTTVDRHRDVIHSRADRGVVVVVAPAIEPDELRCAFSDHDLEHCSAAALAQLVRAARDEKRPFVGVIGDDAALRVAAEELAGSDVALLPVGPSQFATTFGIATVDDAARAAKGRTVRDVDLGRVNDRAFLNSARIGEDRESLPAALRQLADGRRIRLAIDGRVRPAWFVFVGNDCYGENTDDAGSRETVDDHLLDVRIARADQRFAATRLLRGKRFVERRTCTAITVDVRGRTHVDVLLDGELVTAATPLRFASEPNALKVLMP